MVPPTKAKPTLARLRGPATLAALAAAALAPAYVFTLDAPNPVLVRPASGTLTYEFTGTVATGANEYIRNYGASAVSNANGDSLIPEPIDAAFAAGREPNSSFTGPLFRLTIDANTPLGVYDDFFGTSFVPVLDVGFFTNGVGGPFEVVDIPYTVTVQAVPEPASLAALGLGAAALLRRRRGARR